MSDKTKIEWCTSTWSPVTGCTPVSEGCKHCYAASLAKRFWGERKFSDVQCHPDRLDIPLKWKKPRRIFICSMADLFHESISFEFILNILNIIQKCQQHTFIVLTKRPERLNEFCNKFLKQMLWRGAKHPDAHEMINYDPLMFHPNLHIGVSVENQEQADKRIPELLKIPAAVKFISVEPMLSAVNLQAVEMPDGDTLGKALFSHGSGTGIDSVICGCESGPGARETKIEWVRSLRDQCKEAGTPFFLKQLMQNGKLVKMPLLDGVRHAALAEGGYEN